MSVVCPNCKTSLSWWKLKSEFSCPQCARTLSAKITWPLIATLVLWTIADIPVKLVAFELFGSEGLTGILARAIASGLVGYVLAYLIVGNFSSVTERHVQ